MLYNCLNINLLQENNQVSRFIVYGDMGAKMSKQTRHAIETLRQLKNIDAVLHVGDFAYDLNSDGGKVGTCNTM